jgi:hypothetical protein
MDIINQYEWDVVEQKPEFWHSTLTQRLPLLTPLFGIIAYLIITIVSRQPYINTEQMIILLIIAELVVFVVVNAIWFAISKAAPIKLTHFKISSAGVEYGNKKITLVALQTPTIIEYLEKNAIPYAEWDQPRPIDGKPFELIFETTQGKIKLYCPEEYVQQKCIHTLKDILHSQNI